MREVDVEKSIRSATGISCVSFQVLLKFSMKWCMEAVFRIVDGLQLAERVRGFVGITCDHIALVYRNERHDTFLHVFSCFTVADVRMDMEYSDGGKWKISSGNMACVVG